MGLQEEPPQTEARRGLRKRASGRGKSLTLSRRAQVEALACDARVRRDGEPNRATIPPKVRAAVLSRDRHRCAAPGCRSTHFLEVHHVMPRAQGGSNRADNLITLCSRCHAFAHENAGAFASVTLASGTLASGTLAPAQVPAGAQESVGI